VKVEVVRAWPDRFELVELKLAQGALVSDAVRESGMVPADEIAGDAVAVAVFGVVASLRDVLRDGDRVELLRPLLIDPKQARRRRAKAARAPE